GRGDRILLHGRGGVRGCRCGIDLDRVAGVPGRRLGGDVEPDATRAGAGWPQSFSCRGAGPLRVPPSRHRPARPGSRFRGQPLGRAERRQALPARRGLPILAVAPMPSLFTTGLLAFALCLVLTLALRACLRRLRQHRARERDHRGGAAVPSLPRLGGVAVLLAAALALGLPPLLHWPLAITGGRDLLRQWAGPVGLVMLVGAADDLWNLRPHWKFTGQIAAALWVVALGVRVHKILFHPLPLWAAALVTVVWLVGCSNAFNLIDGLDGLATGLALFA